MNKDSSIAIIGGGIVGCAIAYELSSNGYANITVLERNTSIPGLNQSSTNEGCIHSGVYYPKDIMPLKANLCVEGNALIYNFLQKHGLPYKKVGKLIVATNPQEEEYLDFFLRVGIENGVPAVKKIAGNEAKSMEPNISNVIAALYVPSAGCTSPNALIKKIKSLAEAQGVLFLLGAKVTAIAPHKNSFAITSETNTSVRHAQADILINSAGLYADEIAKMINPGFPYEIVPTRGEFFQYDKSLRQNIWMNGMHVYSPPYCYTIENGKVKLASTPAAQIHRRIKEGNTFITAGVHISPAYDEISDKPILGNTLTISPLKTIGLGKEDYDSNLHPAEDYIQRVHSFFPNLQEEDIKPHHTGIMSPLKGHKDFVIEKDRKYPNCIHLVGMESPAWTASFAIAKYVKNLLPIKQKVYISGKSNNFVY